MVSGDKSIRHMTRNKFRMAKEPVSFNNLIEKQEHYKLYERGKVTLLINVNYFTGLAQEETTSRTFFLFVYTSQEEKDKEGKIRNQY